MDLQQMALFGGIVQDTYEQNPPDIESWARTLEGCAKLYIMAKHQLEKDPPDFREAARAISVATKAGAELHGEAIMAFVMSGQASDEFLEQLRQGLRPDDSEE